MSELTVSQLAHISAKIAGGALIIVLLSYPIQGFANYCVGEVNHRKQQETLNRDVQEAKSFVPAFVRELLPHKAPANRR